MKQLTVPSSLLENGRCTGTRNDIITRWNINIGRSVARAKTSDSAVKYKVRRSNGIPPATFLDAAHAVYRLERYIYIYTSHREKLRQYTLGARLFMYADARTPIQYGQSCGECDDCARWIEIASRSSPARWMENAFPRFHGGIADEE